MLLSRHYGEGHFPGLYVFRTVHNGLRFFCDEGTFKRKYFRGVGEGEICRRARKLLFMVK